MRWMVRSPPKVSVPAAAPEMVLVAVIGCPPRLHSALAYVHAFGDGVTLVNILFDDFFQNSFCFKNKFNCIASGAMSAKIWRDVVGRILYLLAGIGHGNRQPDFTHDGQVNYIVTHVSNFFERDGFLCHDFAYGLHLKCLSHIDVFQPQVAGTKGNCFRDALGDNAAFHSAQAGERNPGAIVRVEALGFDHIGGVDGVSTFAFHFLSMGSSCLAGCWSREDPDTAVCEHSVYVKKDNFDTSGAVFSRENLI